MSLSMWTDGNELLLSDIPGTESDIIYRSLEDEIDRELLNTAMKKLSSREKNHGTEIRLTNGVEKTQKK